MGQNLRFLRLNSKGQATGGEIALIILLVLLICGVVLYEITKKDNTQIFKAGSQSISPSPVVHFGGCAIIKEYLYGGSDNKTSH